jgi:hypothetical protein
MDQHERRRVQGTLAWSENWSVVQLQAVLCTSQVDTCDPLHYFLRAILVPELPHRSGAVKTGTVQPFNAMIAVSQHPNIREKLVSHAGLSVHITTK